MNFDMMRTRTFIAVFIAAATLTARTQAWAAIEDEFAYYGTQTSPIAVGSSVPFSIGSFDNSLGTLTGITVILTSFDTAESLLYNFSGQNQGFSAATASVPVSVSALGGTTTSATPSAGPFAGVAAPGQTQWGPGGVLSAQNVVNVPISDFHLYEGTGSINFNVNLALLAGTYSGSPNNGNSSLYFGGNGFSYGEIEVEYTYATVPEAGTTWAGLFVFGVCALRIGRRLQHLNLRWAAA
jgi:hypothetical protein